MLLERAAASFEEASCKAAGHARSELAASGRAARLMASLWKSCRNWVEFAVLRTQDGVRPVGETTRPTESERREAEEYRQRIFRILRSEIDNVLAFQELLGADQEMVVARGSKPEDEDTFTLGPDLLTQLTRKREIMLAHWQDVASEKLLKS